MTKRILTIDDSKTIRDMLAVTLEGAGYDVVQAEDGQQGLDALASNGPVDVIITDINMPVMDGITFIKNVRSDPANRRLPILVLSTEGSGDIKQKGRDAGATGWLVKPFDPDKLISVVRKVTP
ncbi:MAG: response regulator [Magnetovibrionaceae bacterium]